MKFRTWKSFTETLTQLAWAGYRVLQCSSKSSVNPSAHRIVKSVVLSLFPRQLLNVLPSHPLLSLNPNVPPLTPQL